MNDVQAARELVAAAKMLTASNVKEMIRLQQNKMDTVENALRQSAEHLDAANSRWLDGDIEALDRLSEELSEDGYREARGIADSIDDIKLLVRRAASECGKAARLYTEARRKMYRLKD